MIAEGNTLVLEGSLSIEDAWDLKQALITLKAEASPNLDLSRLEGLDLSIAQLLLCFARETKRATVTPPARDELRKILKAMGVLRC